MGLRLSEQARREVIQHMAPRYQQASASYKGALLDEVVATTGYARRSAMRLLNHPPQGSRPQKRRHQAIYGPEVQHVLFLLWHQANHICSKRLIPLLPTLIEALERHHHLHVSETCRSQLLTLSAATADRLLRSQRERGLRSLSTTCTGTWLKRRIPLRTFEQWNETCPGFLEMDLVAHCGREAQGSFLYTLTLTDIATGWTECLPLHTEQVLSALQAARALFPFPILGLDTDNGGEFINEHLLIYCEEEGLTFTRGRPDLKNDQCFVEQKNGTVVRQVVGHERFEGEGVYQQLGELYQALRLYVNCFQPSMKLQAKQSDGKKVRRIYDAAKTPLQRLLLSEVLSAEQQCQVLRMVQILDPLRLFEHLQNLQKVLFASLSPNTQENKPFALLSFRLQQCIARPCSTDIQTAEHAGQQEVILQGFPAPVSPYKPEQEAGSHIPLCSGTIACSSAGLSSEHTMQARSLPAPSTGEQEAESRPPDRSDLASQITTSSGDGSHHSKRRKTSSKPSPHKPTDLTIEQAIGDYLAHQICRHRRPKTLEWHEIALGSLQHYLLTEHQCVLLCQITHTQVGGWLAFLQEQPTATGLLRSPSTVQSYARSARAFCQWASSHLYLSATPFAHLPLPQADARLLDVLEPEEWNRLLQACHSPKETRTFADQAASRNRALLWVLFETGMRATEACRLRLGDVDQEQGVLVVRGKGSHERRLTLGQKGLHHLRAYLDGYRLRGNNGKLGDVGQEPLFLSEAGHPLTKSCVTLLFSRLSQRAGITRQGITASLLRESFALRYLQAGGTLSVLQEILGVKEKAAMTRYQHFLDQLCEDQK